MLYVLPPPRPPNPPSPWDSILCVGSNSNNTNNTTTDSSNSWTSSKSFKRPPLRSKFNIKLRSKLDDSSYAALADDDDTARTNKSLSECYFAGKGTALVLPPHERLRPSRRSSSAGSDIQQHLQSMFYLLRQEETLKMAVKLESVHAGRTRYLVVVSCMGRQNSEESCLLGIDCNEKTTVGLVLRVLADTTITLDGDGGFSVSVCGRHHIFKPVSVQAMWSALQTLHKVSSKAREQNYFQGGPTHDWVNYYEQRIESDRSCLNEWHAMDSLESRRPPSPDSVRTKPRERDETEQVIRSTLKEIMMSVDLDEVTSKYIRSRLEEDLDMDLGEFKSFIDQEMLTILGQMDAPTEIFDHVYLGSEWNASNFEELQKNGVGHILNVTREIDNFFPGMFDYLNIRVYDDEKTDLLKYWDNTFKYITKARKEGSKVLVHCKMGVSRSASVVIAYAMKAYNWNFEKALNHVKEKRSCIKPNTSFIAQLETYQGILDAMKNKEKLQRSKSETNLKSPELVNKREKRIVAHHEHSVPLKSDERLHNTMSGQDLRHYGVRPKSWSPDYQIEQNFVLERVTVPIFLSLENLCNMNSSQDSLNAQTSPEVRRKSSSYPSDNARHVLMPLNNGQSYSVSPNQIVHICKKRNDGLKQSVKYRVNELESQVGVPTKLTKNRKSLVLNLTNQFESAKAAQSSSSPLDDSSEVTDNKEQLKCVNLAPPMLTAKLLKKEIWDPGEAKTTTIVYDTISCSNCDPTDVLISNESVVWTSSTILKQSSPLNNVDNSKLNNVNNLNYNKHNTPEVFCNTTSTTTKVALRKEDLFSTQLDKVFDREERKQQRNSIIAPPSTTTTTSTNVPTPEVVSTNENTLRDCPSRQSSWSSYDSAVVLGYQGETRDAPSRHSSWGSGDTRTLPSRNSSWGSYDIRPTNLSGLVSSEKGEKVIVLQKVTSELLESTSSGMFPYDRDEIPWYPGTVKRTKQKLERNVDKVKTVDFVENNSRIPALVIQPRSPSTETLTSDCSACVLASDEVPTKRFNIHRSSPDLCEPTTTTATTTTTTTSPKPFHSPNAISKEINIICDSKLEYPNSSSTLRSRLSVSAPERSSITLMSSENIPKPSSSVNSLKLEPTANSFEPESSSVICTAQCSSVKKHKKYLENLHKGTEFISKKRNTDHHTSESENNSNCMPGIVKSLKKEFESKTNTTTTVALVEPTTDSDGSAKQPKGKTGSLPSSPINNITQTTNLDENHDSVEDISVKELVGKYEVGTNKSKTKPVGQEPPQLVKLRSLISKKIFSTNKTKNVRYSCIEMMDNTTKLKSPILISTSGIYQPNDSDITKLPSVVQNSGPLPSVVMATVVKAATKKQKHKKDSNPCLNLKPRNNSVYNTM